MFNFELVLGRPATPERVRELIDDELATRTRKGADDAGQVLRVTITGVDDELRGLLVDVLGAEPAVWVIWGVDNKVGSPAQFDTAVRTLLATSVAVTGRVGAKGSVTYASEQLLLTRDADIVRVYPGLLHWMAEAELGSLGVPYERTDDEGWV